MIPESLYEPQPGAEEGKSLPAPVERSLSRHARFLEAALKWSKAGGRCASARARFCASASILPLSFSSQLRRRSAGDGGLHASISCSDASTRSAARRTRATTFLRFAVAGPVRFAFPRRRTTASLLALGLPISPAQQLRDQSMPRQQTTGHLLCARRRGPHRPWGRRAGPSYTWRAGGVRRTWSGRCSCGLTAPTRRGSRRRRRARGTCSWPAPCCRCGGGQGRLPGILYPWASRGDQRSKEVQGRRRGRLRAPWQPGKRMAGGPCGGWRKAVGGTTGPDRRVVAAWQRAARRDTARARPMNRRLVGEAT